MLETVHNLARFRTVKMLRTIKSSSDQLILSSDGAGTTGFTTTGAATTTGPTTTGSTTTGAASTGDLVAASTTTVTVDCRGISRIGTNFA